MSDKIGKRGENIFSAIISRYVSSRGFLFAPSFMGDKFPAVDFYVGLLNYESKSCFFLALIKCTGSGYNADGSKLKINVGIKEIEQLKKFGVPVYLFGINERDETGYFICANNLDNSINLNGIPTKYPVDGITSQQLWQEVAEYWENSSESRNLFHSLIRKYEK
jgi:hypothetical protein